VTSTTPSNASNIRVAAANNTNTSFAATTSPACSNFTWALNGSTISGATSASYIVPSSSLSTGNNTLQVTVTNGTSSSSQSWTVVKNTPPVCSSQTPSATGNTVVAGSTLTYVANGTSAASLPLTFSWANNGTTVTNTYFTVTNPSAGQSQAVFAPSTSFDGSNNLVATINDGYDNATCTWATTVIPQCSILSSTPSGVTQTIPYLATTSNSFVATANDPSCTVTWKLNGTAISGQTNATLNIASSNFTGGGANDTLQAVYSNGSSTATKTWTVTRNQPPTCSSQTPSATGNTLGSGANMSFTANAGNPLSHTLTYAWQLNNASVSTALLNPSSSGNSSTAIFYPTSGNVGANSITAAINDGYDTATCTWTATVNPTCSFSASSPAANTSTTVAAASGTTTTFSTTPSSGCNIYTWSLDGSTISGATGQNYALPSSTMSTYGNHTLTANLSNGSSSTSQSWTVFKNTPPTCSSQTPAASGNTVGTGQSVTLTANGNSVNGNTLSFSWFDNTIAVNSTYFGITNGTNTSTAIFSPNSTFVGNNTVSANIFDGYDTTSCTWSVSVLPACTITSSSPSGATITVPNLGTASQTYIANANDPSCTVSWKLNGSTLSGQTSANTAVTSSLLGAAGSSNTLVATYSNGVTSTTRTWNITRNNPA